MKKTILFLILALFLIAGYTKCTLTQRPKTIDIYQGTDGIVMEFLKGAPPDKIPENSEFQIISIIENRGASDVGEGYLTISLEKDYMHLFDWMLEEPIVSYGVDNEKVRFQLDGKSEYSPNGGRGIIKLLARTKKIESLIESHTSNIGLTACYKYETISNPTVCLDTDIYNLRVGEKSCEVKDVILSSQGAPVAVTKIEQSMLVHDDKIEPQFLIYIANKGNGQIIDKDKIDEACSEKGGYNLSVVNVEAYLSGKKLDCIPNPVKLTKTRNFARCSAYKDDWIEKDSIGYETLLKINLTYGYTSTISKNIRIEKQY